MTQDWRELAAGKKQRQVDAIPKEWVISTPPSSVLDVTRFPEQCGLLSPKELEITDTAVGDLLKYLGSGLWSSLEVTKAFCKRAIIAHQLVNSYNASSKSLSYQHVPRPTA
jgi:amidase